MDINEIKSLAQSLSEETRNGSITPQRVATLMLGMADVHEKDKADTKQELSDMQKIVDAMVPKVQEASQKALDAAGVANAQVEVVQKLKNDVETYIGSGLEQVVVTCVAVKEGVDVSGLTLNVYYNGDTSNPTQYTTDENGRCSWRVTSGFSYRIVFPQIEGCAPIAPITHTASIAQRSIEVEYMDIPKLVEQTVIHVTKYINGNASAWEGIDVKVTANGKTTTYQSSASGKVELELPVATPYTVSVNAIDSFYIYGKSSQSFIAEQTVRHIYFNYHDMGVGLFITDNEGHDYTYDEWAASGRDESDAMFFKFASANLINNGGVFYIKIDDIANRTYTGTRQWCNNNVQFNTIPSNGSSSTSEYYYDGFGATNAIIEEAYQRGLTVSAAAYCWNMQLLVGNGQMRGFLYSIGQERLIYQNVTPLNAMLALVRPSAAYNFTNYVNTNKWTSAQLGSNAYYVYSGVGYNGKFINYAVVVAYALQL